MCMPARAALDLPMRAAGSCGGKPMQRVGLLTVRKGLRDWEQDAHLLLIL